MDELKFTSVADSSQMEHAKKSQELQNAVSPGLPSSQQVAVSWAQDPPLERAAGAAHRNSSGVLKEAGPGTAQASRKCADQTHPASPPVTGTDQSDYSFAVGIS